MCVTLQRLGRRLYGKGTAEFFCALARLDGRFFAYPRSDFRLLFRSNSRTPDAKIAMCLPCHGTRRWPTMSMFSAWSVLAGTAFIRQVDLERFAVEPLSADAKRQHARAAICGKVLNPDIPLTPNQHLYTDKRALHD
jgi:hypothetical protein